MAGHIPLHALFCGLKGCTRLAAQGAGNPLRLCPKHLGMVAALPPAQPPPLDPELAELLVKTDKVLTTAEQRIGDLEDMLRRARVALVMAGFDAKAVNFDLTEPSAKPAEDSALRGAAYHFKGVTYRVGPENRVQTTAADAPVPKIDIQTNEAGESP